MRGVIPTISTTKSQKSYKRKLHNTCDIVAAGILYTLVISLKAPPSIVLCISLRTSFNSSVVSAKVALRAVVPPPQPKILLPER
jgi:hypothetical protein